MQERTNQECYAMQASIHASDGMNALAKKCGPVLRHYQVRLTTHSMV